jgi:hypothetical protein
LLAIMSRAFINPATLLRDEPAFAVKNSVSVRSRDVWLDGLCRRIDRASGALWSVPPH